MLALLASVDMYAGLISLASADLCYLRQRPSIKRQAARLRAEKPPDSTGLEETSLSRHESARTVLSRLICVNDGVGRAEYHHGICQREQAMPPSDDHQVPIEPTPGDEPTPDKDPTPDDAPVPDHNPVGKVPLAKN